MLKSLALFVVVVLGCVIFALTLNTSFRVSEVSEVVLIEQAINALPRVIEDSEIYAEYPVQTVLR